MVSRKKAQESQKEDRIELRSYGGGRRMSRSTRILTGAVLVLVLAPALRAAEDDESGVRIYAAPSVEEARARALEWVASRGVKDQATLEEIGRVWSEGSVDRSGRELLERVIATFALADPQTREFVEACRLSSAALLPPEPGAIFADGTDEFYSANLRLYYGRSLAQRQMYDEALTVFEQIDPQTVVDPATCLFFKATCQHQLLMKTEGLETIEQLLKNTEQVPTPYSNVATLMQYDLENLKEQSLDEVAKLMKDVERRLDLGRGGQKVQKREEEVIARLDHIIKKLEAQMGGGGGGGSDSSQSRNNQSSAPAQDSTVKGNTAPGEVEEKDLRGSGGWGDLPPKAEAKVKQMIGRNLPAHYEHIIKEYNKKLANRPKAGR